MNNLILYFTFKINFTTELVVTFTLRKNEVLRLLVVLSTIEKKKKNQITSNYFLFGFSRILL
jgi:hypothetical protein